MRDTNTILFLLLTLPLWGLGIIWHVKIMHNVCIYSFQIRESKGRWTFEEKPFFLCVTGREVHLAAGTPKMFVPDRHLTPLPPLLPSLPRPAFPLCMSRQTETAHKMNNFLLEGGLPRSRCRSHSLGEWCQKPPVTLHLSTWPAPRIGIVLPLCQKRSMPELPKAFSWQEKKGKLSTQISQHSKFSQHTA